MDEHSGILSELQLPRMSDEVFNNFCGVQSFISNVNRSLDRQRIKFT